MAAGEQLPPTLEIRLGDVHVGLLTLLANDLTEFTLSDAYRERVPRPVLGQAFEDDLRRRHHSRMRLPPFFSNLLPEGPLRALIAKQVGINKEREFLLLARLGEDLPGAVIARPVRTLEFAEVDGVPEAEPTRTEAGHALRFSLAGVQLKFSMLRSDERGMTLPATGRGGDWIVKLPDNRFPRVPENEFAMMTWARAAGIIVPEFELVKVADLRDLPEGVTVREDFAFAIRRFDRPSPHDRVHMEDMAQVLGLYPDAKYEKYNYDTIGRLLLNTAGIESLWEFLRRLVFIIAIGNADAHHKNWSLLYPDGVHATLSPAYDFVSTIQYIDNDGLALNLARTNKFTALSIGVFERLAGRLKIPPEDVIAVVKEALERTREAWLQLRSELPISKDFQRRLEAHWQTVPLLRGNL